MEGKRTSKEFSEFQVEFYELHPRIITFLLKSPFMCLVYVSTSKVHGDFGALLGFGQ